MYKFGNVLSYKYLFVANRSQWKSRRKRHRPDDDNDDCVVIGDSEQNKKDSNLGFVTAMDQYVSLFVCVGHQPGNCNVPGLIPSKATLVLLLFS